MRYFLMQEDQLLGTLDSYDSDFPWVSCHIDRVRIVEVAGIAIG